MEFGWKLTDPPIEFGGAISGQIAEIVREQAPDLLELFPIQLGWDLDFFTTEGWIAVTVVDWRGRSIPHVGRYSEERVRILRKAIEPFRVRSLEEVANALGNEWFDSGRFTYVGPFQQGCACWPHVLDHLISWLNGFVVPRVLELNQQRVLRAIPVPPQFDLEAIRRHLWVLECAGSNKQGTAFSLAGHGLVTCEHVLGPASQAFRAYDFQRKFPIRVRWVNKDIDLAILEVDGDDGPGLTKGSADGLKEMAHLAVAGFPNYRIGDSGVISPGLVVGFRMRSAIRRILTNAAIVAGASGGPVLDGNNRVVGVAVTGADRFDRVPDTENHGIIPIDALDLIQRLGR